VLVIACRDHELLFGQTVAESHCRKFVMAECHHQHATSVRSPDADSRAPDSARQTCTTPMWKRAFGMGRET